MSRCYYICCDILRKGIRRYNKNKLCNNNEVATNQRQKQPITNLSKGPKPVS